MSFGSSAAVTAQRATLRPSLPAARRPLLRQIVDFLIIGVGCTVVTAVLYLVLRTWLSETWANLLAFAVTTVISSVANRKITFGEAQTVSRLRLHAQSVLVFLFYATSTTVALDVLDLVVAQPTPAEQAAAVWMVSMLGGTARFLLLRAWVFRERVRSDHSSAELRQYMRDF
jgi:putative flippase GtrA